MDEKTKQRHQLWRWSMDNLRPRTLWRFSGSEAGDAPVLLEVRDITWDHEAGCYDVEFESIYVLSSDGVAYQALPTTQAPLPKWFEQFMQPRPTPYFMLNTAFKELLDAGRISPYLAESAT